MVLETQASTNSLCTFNAVSFCSVFYSFLHFVKKVKEVISHPLGRTIFPKEGRYKKLNFVLPKIYPSSYFFLIAFFQRVLKWVLIFIKLQYVPPWPLYTAKTRSNYNRDCHRLKYFEIRLLQRTTLIVYTYQCIILNLKIFFTIDEKSKTYSTY